MLPGERELLVQDQIPAAMEKCRRMEERRGGGYWFRRLYSENPQRYFRRTAKEMARDVMWLHMGYIE